MGFFYLSRMISCYLDLFIFFAKCSVYLMTKNLQCKQIFFVFAQKKNHLFECEAVLVALIRIVENRTSNKSNFFQALVWIILIPALLTGFHPNRGTSCVVWMIFLDLMGFENCFPPLKTSGGPSTTARTLTSNNFPGIGHGSTNSTA